MIPTADNILNVLKALSKHGILALRPFSVHIGDNVRKENDYRQKTNLLGLTWDSKPVLQKREELTSSDSKLKCMTAYHFLMSSENSNYNKFIDLREADIASSNRFNVYDFKQNVGVECALWPNLYPTIDLCEITLSGKEHRASTKVAFMRKVFSEVSDYGTSRCSCNS